MSLTPLMQRPITGVRRRGQLLVPNRPGSGSAPPVNVPITGGFSGGGTTGVSIDLRGGPTTVAGTLTITGIVVDGTPINDPPVVPINVGDVGVDVAKRVEVALRGLTDAGGTITLATARHSQTIINVTATGGTGNQFDADPSAVFA